MLHNKRNVTILKAGFLSFALAFGSTANAQIIPNTANVDRIKPAQTHIESELKKPEKAIEKPLFPKSSAPDVAKTVKLLFKGANIEGVTVFGEDELKEIYKQYINKDTTLEIAWIIADALTHKYNQNGYFLSRAYVPEQEVVDGKVTIKVVEGYIGDVALQNPDLNNRIIKQSIADITSQRPIKAEQIDSFLLKINDLPGQNFKGILSELKSNDEAAAKMTLVQVVDKSDVGSVSIDNYGSRYIGPTEFSAAYKTSILPLQQTDFTISGSLPTNELFYGSLEHFIAITPEIKIGFNADKTKAFPSYTLSKYNIESESNTDSANLYYQLLRQRQENISLKLGIDARNTNTTLLGKQISHDQIRVLRAGINYDVFDHWDGYNVVNLKISKGINGLSSSKEDDLNLSKSGAKPNFSKIELSLQRQQALNADLSLIASASMQHASGILYSSEEFGYGGQNFGRAYDSSDIVGDHGIEGSLELRYNLINDGDSYLMPYGFYDLGRVWTEKPSSGSPQTEAGSSAGIGARFLTNGITGNIGIASPLTRDISVPIYGHNKRSARLLLQLSKEF